MARVKVCSSLFSCNHDSFLSFPGYHTTLSQSFSPSLYHVPTPYILLASFKTVHKYTALALQVPRVSLNSSFCISLLFPKVHSKKILSETAVLNFKGNYWSFLVANRKHRSCLPRKNKPVQYFSQWALHFWTLTFLAVVMKITTVECKYCNYSFFP